MRTTTARLSIVQSVAAALLALACTTDDPPPRHDGGDAQVREGGARADVTSDVAPGSDLSVVQGLVRRTCGKIAAACQQKQNPGGEAWSASITPWSQAQCETVQLCILGAVGQNCVNQMLTYLNCLDRIDPFDCGGCLNNYQFVQGSCPCLKTCDPSCP